MKHLKAIFRAVTTALPGILLAFALAIPAWFAGKQIPVIGGAIFALVFGLLVGSVFRPKTCVPGIRFTGKKILQYSIILLGFEMQIRNVIAVGSQSLVVMLFTLTAAFVTAAVCARLFRVKEKQAILIGVGTCVCGGSAIAATAPVIEAGEDDVARAISTIFLFNVIAVFLFPALGRLIGLSDAGFGLWAGTAINDTSSVVAAAASWSEAAGNGTALAIATIVKLTRTLLIIPITLTLALWTARKTGQTGNSFNFIKVFPWFVLGFVAAALANSFLPLPVGLPQTLAIAGKFLIVAAMAAIGLSTNVKNLIAGGKGPIALGLACWIAVTVVSLAAQGLTGTLTN
jgi:uncharacterized integral membrane protein (TIGR00698 family)